jgi:hypothetical protein
MIMRKVVLLLFIILPIITFILGMNYQNIIDNVNSFIPQQKSCTYEAKICPDGSSVGRSGPNCEFAPCPTVSQLERDKIGCSEVRGLKCPEGYICDTRQFPDASGICVKLKDNKEYQCPESGYVDCMPGPNRLKKPECTPQYLQWAEENCPNFKGAAY